MYKLMLAENERIACYYLTKQTNKISEGGKGSNSRSLCSNGKPDLHVVEYFLQLPPGFVYLLLRVSLGLVVLGKRVQAVFVLDRVSYRIFF